MDILSDKRLLVINYLGTFLFVLKALGVWVGVSYSWLICMIIWQPVVTLVFITGFLAILGIIFTIMEIFDFYEDFSLCKYLGHNMYFDTTNAAGAATCKRCGHKKRGIEWPRE